jgi:prevent-host-death family protein
MATVVTATDLRTRIRELIQRAQFQNDHVIVTVFDRPAVAIIGMDDFRDYLAHKEQQQQRNQKRWQRLRSIIEQDATLDELTDEELQELVKGIRAAGQANGQ